MTEFSRRGFLTMAPKAVAGIVLASSFPEIAIWKPDVIEARTPYPLLDHRMVTETLIYGMVEVWRPRLMITYSRELLHQRHVLGMPQLGEKYGLPTPPYLVIANATAGCDIAWAPNVPLHRESVLEKGREMGRYMRRQGAIVSVELPPPIHTEHALSLSFDRLHVNLASGIYYNIPTDQMVMSFRCLGASVG